MTDPKKQTLSKLKSRPPKRRPAPTARAGPQLDLTPMVITDKDA
jgi:hypothetical protein